MSIQVINCLIRDHKHSWDNFHGNLWDHRYPDGYPDVDASKWPGWPTLLPTDSNYNTVLSGPTGSGKTGGGVELAINDGIVQGHRVYSNVPIQFYVRNVFGTKYLVQSLEFDVAKFVAGDQQYWDAWCLIDEGNFSMDQKKWMSNMNIGMTDILQEGRKMGMSVIFTAINPRWLDPRFTGSLLDLSIEMKDLHFTPYGREHKIPRGVRTHWTLYDISGKATGTPGAKMLEIPFFNRGIWGTFNTRYFINPIDARRRMVFKKQEIVMVNGVQEDKAAWLDDIHKQLIDLKDINNGRWDDEELWQTLGVKELGQRQLVGRQMTKWGVVRKSGHGVDRYELSGLQVVS